MSKLVKIGNSQGVLIPRALIEQAQLEGRELEFEVLDEGLLIRAVRQPRQGWKQAFEKAAKASEDEALEQDWLDAPLANGEEW